jgi:hypothetical protein
MDMQNQFTGAIKLEKQDIPKPLLAGIIYGEIAYWMVMASMLIVVVGFVIYLVSGGGRLDSVAVLNGLWQGNSCQTIWKEVGGLGQPPSWYWCFNCLSQGDGLATLGIAITCFAGVAGAWGATLGMIRSKGGIYIIFGLVISIILTLSALGVVGME